MPINLYRAIIWSSLLIVLGEGLILARFNFEPIRGGEVLGENTFAFFDELENSRYPATYYVDLGPNEIDQTSEIIGVSDFAQAQQEVAGDTTAALADQRVVKEEPTQSASKEEVETNKVMEALKPNSGIIANKNADTRDYNRSSADVVDALIRKNKRIYHTDIKKALERIGDTLD